MSGANVPATKRTNLGLRIALGDIRGRGPKLLADSLAEALRQAVRDGWLPAGTPLPATRALAADLTVSRGVVVRAYEQLVAEGYLRARTGRGTVVGEVHTDPVTPSGADRIWPATPGLPALRWFPRREWLRALQQAMSQLTDADLGYGDPRGHPRLRQALASYVGRTRAVVAAPAHIVITGGFAQAIRLTAEALARRGVATVGIEDPGSVGVAQTLRASGVNIQPVPVDRDGLDIEALRAVDPRAVLVTPAHQFPTGAVLAPARRTALLEWARQRQAVVIEDDYDAEYRYDQAPVGALQGLAPDRVVYGGSVSKTLAPGLRLGWAIAPGWLADELAEAKFLADITTPVLDQVALAIMIETGALDRHIRRTASRYASVRERLLQAVTQHLPGWTVSGVAAGLHAVLEPPEGQPPASLRVTPRAGGRLAVTPLADYAQGGRARAGLVVGYGSATPDQVAEGVRELADLATAVAAGGHQDRRPPPAEALRPGQPVIRETPQPPA